MKIGYARAFKADPLEVLIVQEQRLREDGCAEVLSERTLSSDPRFALDAAIERCGKGDTLVLETISVAAKSVVDLPKLLKKLAERQTRLRVLFFNGEPLETETGSDSALFKFASGLYELEIDAARERHLTGVAAAKAEGRYRGRKPTARSQANLILDLRQKNFSPGEIAERLSISRASVYRVLQSHRLERSLEE